MSKDTVRKCVEQASLAAVYDLSFLAPFPPLPQKGNECFLFALIFNLCGFELKTFCKISFEIVLEKRQKNLKHGSIPVVSKLYKSI